MAHATGLDPEKSTRGADTLEAEGWERRSVLDEPRLSEAVRLYEELGFEVKLIDPDPADCDGCTTCFEGDQAGRLRVVYTKER